MPKRTRWKLLISHFVNACGVVRRCDFSFQASVGLSGGLLILWDMTLWEAEFSRSINYVLMVSLMANVYTPCDSRRKKDLRIQLWSVVNNSQKRYLVCVQGL